MSIKVDTRECLGKSGDIVEYQGQWFTILNYDVIYWSEDEDGIATPYPRSIGDAGAEIVAEWQEYTYYLRSATPEEITVQAERTAQQQHQEREKEQGQAEPDNSLSETNQHQERQHRHFQEFLSGNFELSLVWTGYDLPAILYNHPHSPIKQVKDQRSPEGWEVCPQTIGNGLGYSADPKWIEQLFEFAFHSDHYTEELTADWLRKYAPYSWHSVTDAIIKLWISSYTYRGCAGSEFYRWLAYRKYPRILAQAKQENWNNRPL